MDEFLKTLNTRDVDELERLWSQAARLDLHHTVLILARRHLELLLEKDQVLPQAQSLLRQLTVSCFYTGVREDLELGRWASNELASSKSVHPASRDMGRGNQIFYTPVLDQLAQVSTRKKLNYDDIAWNVNNPSIVNFLDELWLIQRSVNYKLLPNGSYDTGVNDPIRTQNYLVRLDHELNVMSCHGLEDPQNWPKTVWPLVQGFEDCRLFVYNNRLWTTCTVRDQHPEGLCQIYMFEIQDHDSPNPKFGTWHHLPGPEPTKHQKNWMPMTPVNNPAFVYMSDPVIVVGGNSRVISLTIPTISADNYRGGGQVFVFDDGFLGIVHESITRVDGLREYVHRFVKYNLKMELVAVSDSFKLNGERIEFAAGITTHPTTNDVIISYGVNDKESWLCTLSQQEIRKILNPVA